MNISPRILQVAVLAVVGAGPPGAAFLLPPGAAPRHPDRRGARAAARAASPLLRSTASDASDFEGATAILAGSSPKALRLRQQVRAAWTDPGSRAAILLHGPKGSGKGELAEEIAARLPSWQTRDTYRLSLEDGLDYPDTILGTESHPGLLDDLATRANATVIVKGFQSRPAGSKERYDRREELTRALSGLVGGGTYYSAFAGETRPFLPRVIGCTQRDPSFFQSLNPEKDDVNAVFIKVPSLDARSKDLADISRGKIRTIEGRLGLRDVTLGKEATQRLRDHAWGADADAELDAELCRGLERLAAERRWLPFAAANALEPRHLLVAADDEKIRTRLLYDVPFLRNILMSPWVFGKTLRYIVTPVFVAFVAVLFLGEQGARSRVRRRSLPRSALRLLTSRRAFFSQARRREITTRR